MKKKHIKIALLIFFGIGMILGIILFISWKRENKTVEDIVEKEVIHIRIEEEETYLDKKILNDNPDTIGWLTVDGTNINYPVVQYKDNEFYLTHDFNKDYNTAGWVFMDSNNKMNDQNLVIYAHHRHDKSMFGSLDDLYNQKGEKDLKINLITTDEKITYKVFSIYKINKDDYYTNKNFDHLEETIKEFQNRSVIDFHQNIEDATQIITLSTCHNNNVDRIVVQGWR